MIQFRFKRFVSVWAAAQLTLLAPQLAEAKAYKGGELFSQQTYKYGRMEMRMRMALGSGILSTFFTYKDGSEGQDTFWEEIDIEVFGKDEAKTWQSNIITGLGDRTTSEEEHTLPTSLAEDYHTYALVWTPEYVAWELDGTEVRRTTGDQVADLENPQSLRFNLWAANIASWVGEFDDSVLPQHQFVLWIKYSSYQNGQFVHEWTDEFDSFDSGRWGRANWTFGENLADFDPNNVTVKDGALVLSLTRDGQTGFNGQVPKDEMRASGGASGSGGADQVGTGGTGNNQPQGSGGTNNLGSGGATTGTGGTNNPGDGTLGSESGGTASVASGGSSSVPGGEMNSASGTPVSTQGCSYMSASGRVQPIRPFLLWIPALAAVMLRRRRRLF